jgi:hypothetical protein
MRIQQQLMDGPPVNGFDGHCTAPRCEHRDKAGRRCTRRKGHGAGRRMWLGKYHITPDDIVFYRQQESEQVQ